MKKIASILTSVFMVASAIAFAPSSTATEEMVYNWGASASATTQYNNNYRADYAVGEPDASVCGDVPNQAWTYGSPWTGSQLVVNFAEPVAGEELRVYLSNDLEDDLRMELSYENLEGWWLFSDIADDFTCADNADTEYPNNIMVSRPLDGVSLVTGVRFTVLTEADYPEIDAVAVVSKAPTKPSTTKRPGLAGKTKVGEDLYVKAFFGSWSGYPQVIFTYKWFACTKPGKNVVTKKPAECKVISGASQIGFRLTSKQKGKYIRVQMTGTNSAGSKSVFSKASKKVS